MITVIDIPSRTSTPIPAGRMRTVLAPTEHATRAEVAVIEVEPGRTHQLGRSDRTRVAYVLEGEASLTHTSDGTTAEHNAQRRTGIYLEPGEEATVTASGSAAVNLLLVTVPTHVGKAGSDQSAVGYFFEEARLRTLIDEKGFRRRTFWVNKETGLSGSWDLQLGRMNYAAHAHSPRHVHHRSKTSPVVPEHFYLIEKGTGEVKHDAGSLSVGPGSLVLIPAGEWHQLVASETGFDYIEFQAPFDFVTTMDHDPLGKNWYISGTDDGTGKPKLWVQS
jgi:mannose-6-phosphate isomerase-like protein (cupin superfamily)